MKIKFMPWLEPALPVLLLIVMTVLPGCACGSSSLLAGLLTKRAHCADIGSLSLQSLKLPVIIGDKKACFSALNPPATTTIIQKLPFILSILWQKASGVSDIFPLLTRVRPTLNGKKNSLSPEKVFLPLTQDLVTDDDRASLEKQFRELMDNQQQLTEEHKNRSSIYIAMINEGLRAVVVPGQVIPERLFNTISHWLLDAELALYQQILPETDWLDLLPELQAIAAVSPASAAAGDDGDPDREPDNAPEPALFIAGEFGVQPWIAGLYSQAVLQKQKLLGILRQRVRQAMASGNHDLARILLNRIMVIVADLSDLESSESQASDNLAFQALLLAGLLENSDEVRTYATKNRAVEAPVVTEKKDTSGEGSNESQNKSATKEPLSGSDSKPGSTQHSSDSSRDNPEPEQLKHTCNHQPCPVCKAEVCKEVEPSSAKDLSIGPCYILDLPPEILLRIFKYIRLLDRIAIMQCCSRFAEITANEEQIRDWFHEYIPDVILSAKIAAVEAKMGEALNNVSPVARQALARFLKMAPSFCTHKLRVHKHVRGLAIISSVAAFPDNRIVSNSADSRVRVWRINKDDKAVCTHTLEGHTEWVSKVATLSDCWVISGSAFGTIKVWNINRPDGKYCTDTFEAAHTRSISSIETLPDMWFYSASCDDKVRVYFLTKEGKIRHQHDLRAVGDVSCLKVLPGGQLFAGTRQGYLFFWKATKNNERRPDEILVVYDNAVKCIEMLPNDQLLTCSEHYEIKGWDLKQPEWQQRIIYYHKIPSGTPYLTCTSISPDGQMIIFSKLPYMQIVIFKNVEVDSVFTQEKGDDFIFSSVFLCDGRMVTGCANGIIKIWDYSDTRPPKQP